MPDAQRSDLQGRVALVTGANHGIGAAIARTLADQGAGVVVTYLRLHDAPDSGIPPAYADARGRDATDVLQAVRADGGVIEAIEADLADATAVPSLFEFAEATIGPVDILINNATGWVADSFKPLTRDRVGRELRPVSHATIDQQFAIDARGAALLIAEFARRLVERGGRWGRIVSLTSGGSLGFPEEASYGAAKAALVNYTMTAALELAEYGVTANAVHPPVTDTGWVTDGVRRFVDESPEHFHVAEPNEVADVIAWLTSERARLVSANVIHLR